jgi:DNA mismatch endonuclease (patch repair protein)
MSQIKGKNTKPEMLVRKYLHANGFRYKLHDKNMPGRPDLVLPKYNTVIFIHGCFWHAHQGCRYFVIPKTRSEWWKNKIYGNRKRDKENLKRLKEEGWNVIQVWECELKSANISSTLAKLADHIKNNEHTSN